MMRNPRDWPIAGIGLALALTLAAPRAHAQDANFLGNLLNGLGMTTPEPPQIDYRERPPLVVPPRSTLPAPQDRTDARRAANWPDDETERQRRAARDDAQTPATERDVFRRNQRDRLSGDELARGRISRDRPVEPRISYGDNSTYELYYEPMQRMREVDAMRAARQVERPLGQEPPRRFLIEPPTGYRAATERVKPESEPVIRRETDGIREFQRGERF